MSASPTPPAFIMVRPQLGENIGAAARAMLNFGLADLRLVAPRDGWPNGRAIASASRAFDWIEPKLFPDLDAAVADLTFVVATTGRRREFVKDVLSAESACAAFAAASLAGERTGLLFGPERAGLETNEIAFCRALLTLPVNPDFPSLNVAQSVVICAYEWAKAQGALGLRDVVQRDAPATQAELGGLFVQLETELTASGFFHPPEKTPAMIRNIRAALARGGFTEQEVRTLRGMVKALVHGRGRFRHPPAPEEPDA